jgi:hypothetical protein
VFPTLIQIDDSDPCNDLIALVPGLTESLNPHWIFVVIHNSLQVYQSPAGVVGIVHPWPLLLFKLSKLMAYALVFDFLDAH